MRVLFKRLPAREIFNACDPGLLHNVAVEYGKAWWNPEQDELRRLLREWFIELFDELTGHYTKLRESITAYGVQNPIVVTAGVSIRRAAWMLPKDYGVYLCESCGGSRLMIAQELGLDVPCIVNDQIGVDGELLLSKGAVLEKFTDKRQEVVYGPPTYVVPKAFSHMPDTYQMKDQQLCRQKVKREVLRRARMWRKQNMKEFGK